MNWKSIWAVFAGMLAIIVATTLVDIALYLLRFFPPMESDQPLNDMQCVIATSYRVVLGVAGAWLTARLAPRRPMMHAMVLGLIGAILGVAGCVVTWNSDLGPHWYPVAHAVLAIPECWLGGTLFLMRKAAA